MAKQKAVRLYLDNTFEEKKYPFHRDKLNLSKNDTVEFEPICVFTERKPRYAFWKGTKKLIFFVDGALKALRFSKATSEMQTHWTKKEARDFVYKEVALSLERLKPMTWAQFVLILIPVILNLVVLIFIAGRLGVF